MEATEAHDEMTAAHNEQLSDDLAKKAEAARASFVYDEGYYLAQYKKSTSFVSTDEEFTRKDGSGSFKNVFYNIPRWAMVFELQGSAGRKDATIIAWDKPKGFSFQAAFREVLNSWQDGSTSIAPESVNGGLLQACASSNGFVGKDTNDLLEWYANHMVVIHIGVNTKKATKEKYNVVRSVKPYNG